MQRAWWKRSILPLFLFTKYNATVTICRPGRGTPWSFVTLGFDVETPGSHGTWPRNSLQQTWHLNCWSSFSPSQALIWKCQPSPTFIVCVVLWVWCVLGLLDKQKQNNTALWQEIETYKWRPLPDDFFYCSLLCRYRHESVMKHWYDVDMTIQRSLLGLLLWELYM